MGRKTTQVVEQALDKTMPQQASYGGKAAAQQGKKQPQRGGRLSGDRCAAVASLSSGACSGTTRSKPGKRCRSQAGGSAASRGGDYCKRNQAKPGIMRGLTPDPCSAAYRLACWLLLLPSPHCL